MANFGIGIEDDGIGVCAFDATVVIVWPVAAIAGLAAFGAGLFALQFRSFLPLSETMAAIQRKWFFLDACSAVLFMGERFIFDIFGNGVFTFSAVLGTEGAVFLGLMRHFWAHRSRMGMLFVLFWLGTAMFGESFFIADAKGRYILDLLESGGFCGPGGRDWGQKLAALGLQDYCVGLGQMEFFTAWWLIFFSCACALWLLWKRTTAKVPV
ncbi:MAG: hypothetical protein HY922_16880 [Elusimicrobia bacterium]|nr:hypothetical protein [Elusimicrobiota bacterium]